MLQAVPKPQRVWNEPFRRWIGTLPCLLCYGGVVFPGQAGAPDSWEKVEACHVKSRGSGAGDVEDGVGNLYPGCHDHNQEHGRLGTPAFERKHHISLDAARRRYWSEYERAGFPET